MQTSLRVARTGFNIELMGVNLQNHQQFNYKIPAGLTLPWLQDTPQENVWGKWATDFHDLRIVDATGRLYTNYNLTTHNIALSANYQELRNLLLAASQIVDSDGDHLPDAWEQKYFGNLASGPNDDPDGDGYSNLTELALGTSPIDANATPNLKKGITRDGRFFVIYKRWAGNLLTYTMGSSIDLSHWAGTPDELSYGDPLNLYDGTGTSQIAVYLKPTVKQKPFNFFSVQFK